MKERRIVYVPESEYPDKPLHGRNWENFFLVIERDAGKVAIVDGDKHEIVAHIDTGYAVHVLKTTEHSTVLESKDPGRFWYTMGRDGKLTKIDLWQMPEKMRVSGYTINLNWVSLPWQFPFLYKRTNRRLL